MPDFLTAGLAPDFVDYEAGWELQRQIHQDVASGKRRDTVILLEHTPVYTAGKRTEDSERPQDGTPVIDVDRGGKITWHGPGQLIGYPIMQLPRPIDVVGYVRWLEQVLIDSIAEFGLYTERVDGRSGVWAPLDGTHVKVAAIGIRVADHTTMHGFALNVNTDLGDFDHIVPCGIRGKQVASMEREIGHPLPLSDVKASILRHFADVFEAEVLLTDGSSE